MTSPLAFQVAFRVQIIHGFHGIVEREGGIFAFGQIPGKTVEIGANIELWQGFNKIEIVVKGLSEQRQKASIAQTLYEETPESVARREKQALEHKLQIMFAPHPEQRPDKKQRRKLLTLKHHFE